MIRAPQTRTALKHFQEILATLKLPHYRLHDLRHTSASLLLAQGVSLHEVKEILGHSQIALTANLYGHGYLSVMRDSVARLEGALLNPVAPSVAPSPLKSRVQ